MLPDMTKLNADLPPDQGTVYAHVERTVHALLTRIEADRVTAPPHDLKLLAEAVQALSAWPQFNPVDAHEKYQKLAEFYVDQALRFKMKETE